MRLLGAVIGDISGSWYEFRGFKQRPAALVTSGIFLRMTPCSPWP